MRQTPKLDQKHRERFYAKVRRDNRSDCWLWIGGHNGNGYGTFWVAPYMYYAHRIAYTMLHGKVPNNVLVLHKCDNPSCVNPLHLFTGTVKDNIKDKVSKGRQQTKLTENEVREIRKLGESNVSSTELAKKYDVSRQTVWRILTKKYRTCLLEGDSCA